MLIEEIKGPFNKICCYFGVIPIHNPLTVRGCLGEVAPNVPAMCRVFVDHQFDWSPFILLHLEPRDAILRWPLGIKVAHLHQKRHRDPFFRHKANGYWTAPWNLNVSKKTDRVI